MSKYSDFNNLFSPWHALSRPHLFAYKNLYDFIFFHILNMKLKKTQNPSILLGTHCYLILKSGVLDFFFLLNLANLGHFFHEKTLCMGLNHFFRSKFGDISPKKKKRKNALAQAGAKR